MEYTNTRNPVLPPEIHIPDSEAHVFSDGRLYIYGSFDDLEGEYCSNRYYAVSTSDMEHWKITPDIFDISKVTWGEDAKVYPGDIDWEHPTPFMQVMIGKIVEELKAAGVDLANYVAPEKPYVLFAPDCIEKDGKYYLYFCTSRGEEGVAVSDSPEGPFDRASQMPCGGIDPSIFIDRDGSVYYYWGQMHGRGVKLKDDMRSFDEEDVVDHLLTEEDHFFHEGSSVRRIGDTYYYVFADVERGRPTALGYATSDSPMVPFTYRGIIIDNAECDPKSWNNHGSIECYKGQWYVFYHRCSRGTEQHRRLCIEPITILPDGTIPEVKMTSQGAGKPFRRGEVIEAFRACSLVGSAYIAPDQDGKERVCNLASGDEVIYRYIQVDKEFKGIKSEGTGSGKLEVFVGGTSIGTAEIVDGVMQETAFEVTKEGIYELKICVRESASLELVKLMLV